MTKSMLQQALSSHRVAIDRSRLAASRTRGPAPTTETSTPPGALTIVVPWPASAAESAAPSLPVPDVQGVTVREAALLLHGTGSGVDLRGTGLVAGTSPGPGEETRPGATVIVWTGVPP